MKTEIIFGYEWETIQAAQQEGSLAKHLPMMHGQMTPSKYEKNEWLRCSASAYEQGFNWIGSAMKKWAETPAGTKMPIALFDNLQSCYRHWLNSGFDQDKISFNDYK
tara:strand:+ start:344 stop:664 length:321 start_codon:yes stop_codon:yes gene_type:complete